MDDILFLMPEWCDDCETWHRSHYWSTEQGYSVCDDDGDHNPIDAEDLPSLEEVDKAWRDYSQWVAHHGEDPLSEFMVRHARKVRQRWQFYFADSILGPMVLEAKRTGKRLDPHEFPEHIRSYLNLSGDDRQMRKLGDFATWAELEAAVPGVKRNRWHTFRIEHDEPRKPATVARELRRLARKHLRQNPVKEAA